jgi:hypothetical protein
VNAVTLPEKLGKVLAQLEVESDGVRLAAVSAATRILQEHGLRWCQVSVTAGAVIRPEDRPCRDRDAYPFGGRDWRYIATRCRQFPHLIDAWEDRFLADVPRRSMMTAKQSAKLVAIFVRLRAAGCAI